jgi:mediator of RNA polymerase II transcription subunit 17, fungi type
MQLADYLSALADRRLASLVWLNTEDGKGPVAQGNRVPTRLCVFIISEASDGSKVTSRSTFIPKRKAPEDERVEEILDDLQREAVEREIYAEIVGNVANLTTAPAWVREQTITVDISASVVLKFVMVPEAELEASPLPDSDTAVNAICDVIYHALRLLLLRMHAHSIEYRNALATKHALPVRPALLQGVVELFQYYLFVNKLESHLVALITGLRNAGVEVLMRFNRLGSTADELIGLLATSYSADNTKKKSIGGEVILHIAKRCVFHLSLTGVHVDEAT